MSKNINKSVECETNSAYLYHSISENMDLIQNEKKAEESLHLDDVNVSEKKSAYKKLDEDNKAINNNLDNVEKTEIDNPESIFGFSNVDENSKL